MTKLDLGCGKNKKGPEWIGVDVRRFPGVDKVVDLSKGAWPWKKASVDEVHCSHFVEHLTAPQRIHFVNELYRVMKEGATATIVVPHWASARAYGDLTHQWPPVSEFWFFYLKKSWRAENAPHNDEYLCDFAAAWGYSMRQDLAVKNQEQQQYALTNYKEAAQDIVATLTKEA